MTEAFSDFSLSITPDTLKVINDLLKHSHHKEVCGLLIIDAAEQQRFVLLRNLAVHAGYFILDELELERVQRLVRQKGWRPVAFLHTHEQGVEMSTLDRKYFQQNALALPWVIIAPQANGCDAAIYYQT